MKKFLSYIILICMFLHCASRLGFVSYLYKQRHEIAFSLGLTAEKVIAMCSSEYHESIVINEDHSDNDNAPLPHAQEINLFFVFNAVSIKSHYSFKVNKAVIFYHCGNYNSPPPDIFHPPLV